MNVAFGIPCELPARANALELRFQPSFGALACASLSVLTALAAAVHLFRKRSA